VSLKNFAKSFKITQGHSKWHSWEGGKSLLVFLSKTSSYLVPFGDIRRWIMAWPWNLGLRSFKVIGNGTIRKLGYGSQCFSYPLAFDATVITESSSENCHDVWYRKTRMMWLPDGKKNWRCVYSFWQNSRTWLTDGQRRTDGQTNTAWRHRSRLYIASRGKNWRRRPMQVVFHKIPIDRYSSV